MRFRSILISSVLSLMASSSFAWTSIYENDAYGNVTLGSVQALKNALSSGASLKVVVTVPNVQKMTATCSQVSSRLDTDSVVCIGTINLLVTMGVGPNFGKVAEPTQLAHYAISTLGKYSQSHVQIGTGALLNQTIQSYAMQWYVE
jgi:hypothetical protein